MSAVFTPSDADQRRDAETADLFRQAAMLKGAERQRCIQAAIELNLPLAGAIASRYARLGCEPSDLAQVAALGLVKAATRFDPTLGVPFGAFAAPTIRGEVLRHPSAKPARPTHSTTHAPHTRSTHAPCRRVGPAPIRFPR